MKTRLFLARRRAGIHPGFVRAVQAKPDVPPEIFAYPAKARREAALDWRPLKIPAAPQAPVAVQSLRGLWFAYAAVGVAIWFVAANVTPGV